MRLYSFPDVLERPDAIWGDPTDFDETALGFVVCVEIPLAFTEPVEIMGFDFKGEYISPLGYFTVNDTQTHIPCFLKVIPDFPDKAFDQVLVATSADVSPKQTVFLRFREITPIRFRICVKGTVRYPDGSDRVPRVPPLTLQLL